MDVGQSAPSADDDFTYLGFMPLVLEFGQVVSFL
jgi:hypothetical protein